LVDYTAVAGLFLDHILVKDVIYNQLLPHEHIYHINHTSTHDGSKPYQTISIVHPSQA